MSHLAQLVYFMAPAYVANMAPPFTRFWRGWNRPIDERRLGAHKTVLGVVAGVVSAMLIAFVQARVSWSGNLVSYAHWPVLGALFGLGAMGGDVVKSFFKRRRRIPPGASWIPADQLDFVLGALLLVEPIVRLPFADMVLIMAISFVADIIVNQAAFRLGVRETAW